MVELFQVAGRYQGVDRQGRCTEARDMLGLGVLPSASWTYYKPDWVEGMSDCGSRMAVADRSIYTEEASSAVDSQGALDIGLHSGFLKHKIYYSTGNVQNRSSTFRVPTQTYRTCTHIITPHKQNSITIIL